MQPTKTKKTPMLFYLLVPPKMYLLPFLPNECEQNSTKTAPAPQEQTKLTQTKNRIGPYMYSPWAPALLELSYIPAWREAAPFFFQWITCPVSIPRKEIHGGFPMNWEEKSAVEEDMSISNSRGNLLPQVAILTLALV